MATTIAETTSKNYVYGYGLFQAYLDHRLPVTNDTEWQTPRDLWNWTLQPQREYAWISYLLWLKRKPLAFSTARKTFSAIAFHAATIGVRIPFDEMPLLARAKRAWRKAGRASLPKKGITHEQLASLLRDHSVDPLVRACALWAFYALARLKELFDATWTDLCQISVGQPVRLFLPASKTDVFRRGSFLVVSWPIWLIIAKLLGIDPTKPPASRQKIFSKLARTRFQRIINNRFHLSGHSFRRGGAQFLWDLGVSPDIIRRKGRWVSECWRVYIDTHTRDTFIIDRSLPLPLLAESL